MTNFKQFISADTTLELSHEWESTKWRELASVELVSDEPHSQAGVMSIYSLGAKVSFDFEQPEKIRHISFFVEKDRNGTLKADRETNIALRELGHFEFVPQWHRPDNLQGSIERATIEPTKHAEWLGKLSLVDEIFRQKDFDALAIRGSVPAWFPEDCVFESLDEPDFGWAAKPIGPPRLDFRKVPPVGVKVHEALIDATVADRVESAEWWLDNGKVVFRALTKEPLQVIDDTCIGATAFRNDSGVPEGGRFSMLNTGERELQGHPWQIRDVSEDELEVVIVSRESRFDTRHKIVHIETNHSFETVQREIRRRAAKIAIRQAVLLDRGIDLPIHKNDILKSDCSSECLTWKWTTESILNTISRLRM